MRTEKRMAGHRRAFEAGGEFLDVSSRIGDGGGEIADNAGTVVADDIHGERAPFLGGWRFLAHDLDDKSFVAKCLQRGDERIR